MGNKTSLPGPDETIVLTPRIEYLESNRAMLSSTHVDLSTRMSNTQVVATDVTNLITSLNARTPDVTSAITQNSSDLYRLTTNSLSPLSLKYSKVYTTQTANVQNTYQTADRLSFLESIMGAVNVSDLSYQTYNASTSVSNVGVAYSALDVFYKSVESQWPSLDTLRSNVNASTDEVTGLRDARLADAIYQESAVVTVSANTFSGKNDMLSYNSFITSTLSYVSSAFLAAYTNRTAQTNADLTSLQLLAKAVATQMSGLVNSVGSRVTGDITTLGMLGNTKDAIFIDSSTGPMQVTMDLHNKIIYTTISYCLYFGVNAGTPGTAYTNDDTVVRTAGDWDSLVDLDSTSDLVKQWYPDGLTFTVVYAGSLTAPAICFFRFLLKVLEYDSRTRTNVWKHTSQSIDWFVDYMSDNKTWNDRNSYAYWRGGYTVFTVGTGIFEGQTVRRCAIMNS